MPLCQRCHTDYAPKGNLYKWMVDEGNALAVCLGGSSKRGYADVAGHVCEPLVAFSCSLSAKSHSASFALITY